MMCLLDLELELGQHFEAKWWHSSYNLGRRSSSTIEEELSLRTVGFPFCQDLGLDSIYCLRSTVLYYFTNEGGSGVWSQNSSEQASSIVDLKIGSLNYASLSPVSKKIK